MHAHTFSDLLFVELFGCAMETDNIYGLNWPNTKTGELATIRCNTNNNNIWGKIDVSTCETYRYSSLLMMVCGYIKSSNQHVCINKIKMIVEYKIHILHRHVGM